MFRLEKVISSYQLCNWFAVVNIFLNNGLYKITVPPPAPVKPKVVVENKTMFFRSFAIDMYNYKKNPGH